MNILLSIKPEFVSKMFNGEKRFEFRKRIPKKRFNKVFIYESSPTQNIVGWFSIGRIIKGHPDEVWKDCKNESGIEEHRYYEYCNGNVKVYAFEIKEIHKFTRPINPFVIDTDFTPPQNFAYLKSSSHFLNALDNEEKNNNNSSTKGLNPSCPACEGGVITPDFENLARVIVD